MQVFSLEGECIDANAAWETLFQTSRVNLGGYNIRKDSQLEKKGLMPFVEQAYRGVASQPPPILYDPAEIGKPGRKRWLDPSFFPLRDSRGEVHAITLTLNDVTERIEFEERLESSFRREQALLEKYRDSEEQLKLITNAIPSFIAYMDPEARYRYVNRAYADWFGKPLEEIEGRTVEEVLGPDNYSRSRLALERALTGQPTQFETTLKREGGQVRHLDANYIPDVAPSGRVRGAVIVAHDVTLRKQTEESQRFLSEATTILISSLDFQSRLDQIAMLAIRRFGGWCAIHLLDQEGKIQPATIAHSDPEKLEFAWKAMRRFPMSQDRPGGVAGVIRSGRSELLSVITDEMLVARARNEEHLRALREAGLTSFMCVPLRTRRGMLGAITFIATHGSYVAHDLEIAEEMAQRFSFALDNAKLYQEAQDAIQARDDLLSVTSHELRTPITAMKLQLQITRRALDPGKGAMPTPERLTKTFDGAIHQIQKLTTLVDDLLTFSRISAGKLEYQFVETDVTRLVKEVVERFTDQVGAAGTSIEFLAEESVTAVCDPQRMEQVVVNLITNAIKYGNKSPIRVEVKRLDSKALIRVQDFGIGIPKEKQSAIFERFERGEVSNSNISGFGLGLYITRQIVKAHQGSIHVESEPGKGSVFTVELPLRTEAG